MKINSNYKNALFLLVVVGSFFTLAKTLAVSNPYRAGETRDPSCSPGDLFCTVNLDKDLYKENSLGVVSNTTSGSNSIVLGSGSTASGEASIAIGHTYLGDPGATASGDYSVAIGQGSEASGLQSSAFGPGSMASGDYSTSIGYFSQASGNESTAFGVGALAKAFRETSIGSYSLDYDPVSTSSWDESDPILSVGNGSDALNRSNALTILKRGFVGMGTSSPAVELDIVGTGAIRLPVGTEAQRPSLEGKNTGFFRLNNESLQLEYHTGVGWVSVATSSGGSGLNLVNENSVSDSGLPSSTGNDSISIGLGTNAKSFGEIAMGYFPNPATAANTSGFDNSDQLFVIGNGATGEVGRSNALIIKKSGTIGLGNVKLSQLVTAENNGIFLTTETGAFLTSDGTWTDASDESLKTNIQDLSYGLREVNQLQPRSFEFKKSGQSSIGFIAQEVEGVAPEVVSDSGMGTKGVAYGQMTALLVNAVQELSDRVDQLEGGSVQSSTPSKTVETKQTEESIPEPEVDNSEPENPPTEESEVSGQEALLINSSNSLNLTNILLMIAVGLLLINIIIVVSNKKIIK